MFQRTNGDLAIGNTALKTFLDGIHTPVYVYDLDAILDRYAFVRNAFQNKVDVHFAMKANNHPIILRALAQAGCSVDVVSGGEMHRALECGFPADRIVFSGVGKSEVEIKDAIQKGVKQLNIESAPELLRVARIAREMALPERRVRVALRVNPDVNPETHPHITTGFRENKFGLDFDELDGLLPIFATDKKHLQLVGLTLHIGSQIRQAKPFHEAIQKTLKLYDKFKENGLPLESFDVGGGFGIDYEKGDLVQEEKEFQDYAQQVVTALSGKVSKILSEPGRFIVGHFGVLLSQIQYVKRTPHKKFVILNTGMHHIMRPALYDAFHRIEPLKLDKAAETESFDIVGPICESTDFLGRDRELPKTLIEGDWMAILDAGAYGSVMANDYNLHAKPIELVISKGKVVAHG